MADVCLLVRNVSKTPTNIWHGASAGTGPKWPPTYLARTRIFLPACNCSSDLVICLTLSAYPSFILFSSSSLRMVAWALDRALSKIWMWARCSWKKEVITNTVNYRNNETHNSVNSRIRKNTRSFWSFHYINKKFQKLLKNQRIPNLFKILLKILTILIICKKLNTRQIIKLQSIKIHKSLLLLLLFFLPAAKRHGRAEV